jgi:hypothetical protein
LGGMTPRMEGMINIGDDLDNSYFENENDKSQVDDYQDMNS